MHLATERISSEPPVARSEVSCFVKVGDPVVEVLWKVGNCVATLP